MGWHVVAGICQVALTGYFVFLRWSGLVAFFRTGRRTVNTFLYLIPMAALAVATLLGAVWAIVVSAVFYTAWLLNHLLSWWIPARRDRPAPPRPGPVRGHLILGLLLVVVVVVTWYAAVMAYR